MTDTEHLAMLQRIHTDHLEAALADHDRRIGEALDSVADLAAAGLDPILNVPVAVLIDAATSVVPAIEMYLAIHNRMEI